MQGDLQKINDRYPRAHGVRLVAFHIRKALADFRDGQAFEQRPVNNKNQERKPYESNGIKIDFFGRIDGIRRTKSLTPTVITHTAKAANPKLILIRHNVKMKPKAPQAALDELFLM